MIDIDLIYLWVNGNDPKWIEKRKKYTEHLTNNEENCKGRFENNDELKYSLRSIEKYAPWIRKIFIVTDNQIPEWLNTLHPKIKIVDHTTILPKECLPCFNSVVIEHHIHKIPGLSEYFLYANDDMFINQPVKPDFFFTKDLLPIIRFNRRPFRKWTLLFKTKILGKTLRNYIQTIHNAALLVEQKYGTYYNDKTHHNIDAYKKSTYQHARQLFDKEISATLSNHMRSANDIQRNLYSYVALAENKGKLCYVTQHTSQRLHIDNRNNYKKYEFYKPMLFCVNDSQFANDEDRKYVITFLNKLFPNKSKFEK